MPPGPDLPLDLDAQLDRRRLLTRGLALSLAVVPGASLLAGCGDGDGMMGGPMSDDVMGEAMPDFMMSGEGMMSERMMEDMPAIHALLTNHDRIERRVDDIAEGIRAWTTSSDPEIAELIGTHVGQMKERVEEGEPIRHMDPLFREIFEHHDEIEMDVKSIDGGVLVVETSANPQVQLLIRQHAHRAVSEFVAEGISRAMEPTSLPRGYAG